MTGLGTHGWTLTKTYTHTPGTFELNWLEVAEEKKQHLFVKFSHVDDGSMFAGSARLSVQDLLHTHTLTEACLSSLSGLCIHHSVSVHPKEIPH